MTLIAAINIKIYPVLVGDLLVTSPIAPAHRVAIPTIGEITKEQGNLLTCHVVGLDQKICILNDCLAVAWAGRKVYARDIVRQMKGHFDDNPVNYNTLEEFLKSQNEKYLDELSLICIYKTDTGLQVLSANATKIETERFSECHTGGSGQSALIDMLYTYGSSRPLKGEANALQRSVLDAVALMSNLVATEISAGKPNSLAFGGAFEVAVFSDNAWIKIGDVLHLFWNFGKENDEIYINFVLT